MQTLKRLFHSKACRVVRIIALLCITAAIFDLPLDAPASLIVSDAKAQFRPEMPPVLVPAFILAATALFWQIRRRLLAPSR